MAYWLSNGIVVGMRRYRRWVGIVQALMALGVAACILDTENLSIPSPRRGQDAGAAESLDANATVVLAQADADPRQGSTADGAKTSPPDRLEAGKTRYPIGAVHSPITQRIVQRANEIWASSSGRREVFAKVGDSITINSNFLSCFSGQDINLDDHKALEATRLFFNTKLSDTSTPFGRQTLAAAVGWSARAALTGNPSPIAQEIAAIDPAFAIVMFGTNDTNPKGFVAFEKSLRSVVDSLIKMRVVPLLSTIPQRRDNDEMNGLVPEMNAIIRATAQASQVPLMDYHLTLADLPGNGLAKDGIHPQVYVSGTAHPCWLTSSALQQGMNQRNLLVLQALDRVRRFLLQGQMPEEPTEEIHGNGAAETPFVVDALPFVDNQDASKGARNYQRYPCSTLDASGPEWVYEVKLTTRAKLRARVYGDNAGDLNLLWLSGAAAESCIFNASETLEMAASPGTYRLVVDSRTIPRGASARDFRVTLVQVD